MNLSDPVPKRFKLDDGAPVAQAGKSSVDDLPACATDVKTLDELLDF